MVFADYVPPYHSNGFINYEWRSTDECSVNFLNNHNFRFAFWRHNLKIEYVDIVRLSFRLCVTDSTSSEHKADRARITLRSIISDG